MTTKLSTVLVELWRLNYIDVELPVLNLQAGYLHKVSLAIKLSTEIETQPPHSSRAFKKNSLAEK